MIKNIVLTALLFLTFAFNAHAQKWEHFVKEADELLDIAGYESWVYTDKQGNSFIIRSDEDYYFLIITSSRFDRSGLDHMNAIIGYYNMENKLIEKTEIGLQISLERNYQWNRAVPITTGILGYKKQVEQLTQVIREGQGYVRIVVRSIENENFDIKIPCLNNPF